MKFKRVRQVLFLEVASVSPPPVPGEKQSARHRIARGGNVEPKEGKPRSRVVVIEFPSYRAALDCYQSPEYVAAMMEREGRSIMDLAITDGYEGPQPG